MQINTTIEIDEFTESALDELSNVIYNTTSNVISTKSLATSIINDYIHTNMLNDIEKRIDRTVSEAKDNILGCNKDILKQLSKSFERASNAIEHYQITKKLLEELEFILEEDDYDFFKLEVNLFEDSLIAAKEALDDYLELSEKYVGLVADDKLKNIFNEDNDYDFDEED